MVVYQCLHLNRFERGVLPTKHQYFRGQWYAAGTYDASAIVIIEEYIRVS